MSVDLETFVKELADSEVIAPGKLENFIPPNATPKDAEELAQQLVESNHLTKYQVQEIHEGRGKSLILGAYTILDRIGTGGMGQVFKAEHRKMKRVVAIKMLPPAMLKDAAALARFEREVEAAAKLRHPNIVAADDAAEANGVHFLVMEYVEGKDLSALVKKNGPFPVDKAVNYILQAARGLEFAHKKGVVHRDIKPANLLLDTEGTVKILDMGLWRIEPDGNADTQAELTGTGAVMGTVDYMAPEQGVSTKHADARADIYSLGCSLHYLLIGKPIFDGETMTAKLLAHHNVAAPNLCQLRNDVPEQVQAIFAKMVAKKLEDRYQTMTEVIADLGRCQAGLSSPPSTITTSSPPPLPPLDDRPQLADMVRILDVAAEMRSDREMASRELAVDETKGMLRERLLASAKLTGDSATPEEIDAAIENYYQSLYTYREPRWNLSVALAHLYVRRTKLALATTGVAIAFAIGWSLFNSNSGVLSSTAQQASQLKAALQDIESLANTVKTGAPDPQATALIQEQLDRLQVAAKKHDLPAMQAVRQQLLEWQTMLDEAYEVRVVSGSKAKSGIDRYFTDPSGKRVSGYYLIVQARAADGRVLLRRVTNAETGKAETVETWGESVPEVVYERIKADKKADGILDETLFAVKKRGRLTRQIEMKGVSGDWVNRRQITHW